MAADERVIKSYIWHEDKCFFVSTIERDSSATEAPGRFCETIVWDYDWTTGKRGAIVYQTEDGAGCINAHILVCQRVFKWGDTTKTTE